MFVLVNLKAYPCDPVAVADAANRVANETGVRIAVAPQTARLPAVAETGIETWAQHVSPVEYGSHTGSTLAEAVAAAGATGTLLNHSEHRLKLADLADGLAAAACSGVFAHATVSRSVRAAAAAALEPDAVALEPPELIGTGTPVSRADPGIVEDAVAAVERIDPEVEVFCGAGISTGDDLVAARDLGTTGVLLASGVAKADDPATALRDLVDPL